MIFRPPPTPSETPPPSPSSKSTSPPSPTNSSSPNIYWAHATSSATVDPSFLKTGLWTGVRHTTLYAQLKALAELWDPRCIVHVSEVDTATGVGAGLSSFLEKAQAVWLPKTAVIPFLFNSSTKSKLGWDFLAVVETGRLKDHSHESSRVIPEQEAFSRQLVSCQMEINPGPNRTMKWGVPDSTRDESTGNLIHDDLIVSTALCALLDEQEWGLGESTIINAPDPLSSLGEVF